MRAVLSARGASGKEPTRQCRRWKRCGLDSWVEKIPWRRAEQPTPVFLHGESYGQRNLACYSPEDCKESDTTDITYPAHKVGDKTPQGAVCYSGV